MNATNKTKSAKVSNVVVNGKRTSARNRKFSIKSLLSQKIPIVAMVLVFGGVGVYFLVRSFAATPTADMSTFNVTTWNSYYGNKTNVGKSIKALGKNSDIIGIQEAHSPSQRKNIKSTLLCAKCRYQGYIKNYSYSGSSPASLPILWDKSKFSLVNKGYSTLSKKKTGIKDATGNNAKVSAKYVTWVQLRDKATGRSFYVLNLHTVASVEAGGSPNTKNKERLKIYKQNMNVLVSKINQFKKSNRPIIVLGDFNVNYRYDAVKQTATFPYKRLGQLGVHSTYEQLQQIVIDQSIATQGNSGRLIDYIFTLKHDRMTVSDEYIDSAAYGSDHHPTSATMTLYRSAPTVIPSAIPIGTPNPETTDGTVGEQSAIEADAY